MKPDPKDMTSESEDAVRASNLRLLQYLILGIVIGGLVCHLIRG